MNFHDQVMLLQKREPLVAELAPFVESGVLSHPLVHEPMYHEQMNAYINHLFKQRRKAAEDAYAKEDWFKYLFIHEKPYRLEVFSEIQHDLSDTDYWKLLGEVWGNSENLWQYGDMLAGLLQSRRPNREAFMNDDEMAFSAALPKMLVVYRGHMDRNRLGWSWTLSEWKARWFANRFFAERTSVTQARLKRSDVRAVLLRRGEWEIVVDPARLTDLKTFIPRLSPRAKQLYNLALKRFTLGERSHHGPWHWLKVASNAAILTKRTKGADGFVAQVFALLHDCERRDENDDPDHGYRAATYAKRLFKQGKLPIDEEQVRRLSMACERHELGEVSNDPTIGVCWDADRLELPRVGIKPDPRLLSTNAAKNLIWQI